MRFDVSRNAFCPCGSGKKYKRCCLPKSERFFGNTNNNTKINEIRENELSIAKEIDYIISKANDGKSVFVKISLLLFFSTENGDAWLLDLEDYLALRLNDNFERCDYMISETNTNYQIKWTGYFEISGSIFRFIRNDGKTLEFYQYPISEISKYV